MTTSRNIPVDLIAGRLRGGNSKLENSLLERWLAREGNAALYDDIEKLWNEIKLRAGEDAFDENAAWKEIMETIEAGEKIRRLKFKLSIASAVAIIAVAALATFLIMPQRQNVSGETAFATASSKSSLILSDGSHVTLYPESKVVCAADFGRKDRKTSLYGRAFYDIAHDTEKPFHISVDGLDVRVVGTSFDLDARDEEVILNVTDGKVSLSSDALPEEVLVAKGSRAVYDRESGEISIIPADVEEAAVWASDKITFKDEKIGIVCKRLSDWYGLDIIPSEKLSDSGSLSFTVTDESVDVILSIIAKTNGISYRHEGNNTIIIY